MSNGLLIVLLLVSVLLNAGIMWFFLHRKNRDEGDTGSFFMLQGQLSDLRQVLDTKLGESTKMMRESVQMQFTQSQELIQTTTNQMVRHLMDVQKGQVENIEATRQVFSITEKLENLEKVLKNQKQRGSLGEAGLELILSNILPPTAYSLQYGFPGGDVVDAVIHTKDGIIPVDAKFSLDNYQRVIQEEDPATKAIYERDFKNDLKKRIDETSKYIRPEEGTLPFALMYIPAEGIYYDLLVNEVGSVKVNTRSLIDYAYRDKKVIIVSPTTFVAYLSTILQGFKAFQIEKSAVLIAKRVEELMRHIQAYEEYHQKLGSSLATTVNHYNRTQKEFKKIDKDVLKITGESMNIQGDLIEGPSKEQ